MTNSVLSSIEGFGESHALVDALLSGRVGVNRDVSAAMPDWSREFWTPIDVEVNPVDPMVIMCHLDFQKHWKDPSASPMFKDLVGISNCVGTNRRRERLSVLLEEVRHLQASGALKVTPPTGFVFHESRVGSTLVANMLAADPFALVFSESAPLANAILHCGSMCSRAQQVQLFRDVATLMGASPIHNKFYAKFQSITTTKMDIALEVRFTLTSLDILTHRPI